ncbi:MAG: anti-sigma regulatory factor [Chloroflexaceae bacterium]|nr:anti-sigma regulatory factor [Chloroflexaceae bacterium]
MQVAGEAASITIHNELDIVQVRHTVREYARKAGLHISRQAKVTTAISTLARALLTNYRQIQFAIKILDTLPRAALEVLCFAADTDHTRLIVQTTDPWDLPELHLLVDEVDIHRESQMMELKLRMWLTQKPVTIAL